MKPAGSLSLLAGAAVLGVAVSADTPPAGGFMGALQAINPFGSVENELLWFLGGLLLFVFIMWSLLVRNLGTLLKHLMQQMDRKFIGTDITLGSVETGIGLGYLYHYMDVGFKVNIVDATILNPYPYNGDYLFKAEQVLFDVSVPIFTTRDGLTVRHAHVSKLSCLVEYTSDGCFSSQSNVLSMVKFMERNKKPSEVAKEDDSEDSDPEEGRKVNCIAVMMFLAMFAVLAVTAYFVYRERAEFGADKSIWHNACLVLGLCVLVLLTFEVMIILAMAVKVMSSIRQRLPVTVGELDITDGQYEFYSSGLVLHVRDIHYDNFSAEVGSYYADDIIWVIVQSMAKTILAGIAGSDTAERLM